MERVTRFRAHVLVGLLIAVLIFFCFRLYKLQVIDTGGKKDNITTFETTTRVKAARGDILDTNGNVLVSNRASYDLVMNHYVLLTASGTNGHLYRLVQRCNEAGIEFKDTFPITAQHIKTAEGDPLDDPRTPQMIFTMQLPKAVPAHSLIRRSVDLSAK